MNVRKTRSTRWKAGFRAGLLLSILAIAGGSPRAQDFVRRSNGGLTLDGSPFLFVGVNRYDLPRMAAAGRQAEVDAIIEAARLLGLTVLRTWAFHDNADSAAIGVIQSKPGRYHEAGLRGLDYAVARAKEAGLRVILPLVNGWDDFGGMNQYVRWRFGGATTTAGGSRDDFYVDLLIRNWFQSYCAMLAERVNVFTGTAYRDEPAILAWELANEPRSSDPSGEIIARWLEDCGRFLRSVDPNHLIGSGEEGFDGTAGLSFRRNVAIEYLDFASVHLYSDHWGISPGAGNTWIADRARVARESGKGIILGEFGARAERAPLFESWLTTALLEGVSGAVAWQLLSASEPDHDGFGFRYGIDQACEVLGRAASRFAARGRGIKEPAGQLGIAVAYPNPGRSIALLAYELPVECDVQGDLFSITGASVGTVVRGWQAAGGRRELIDLRFLASGAYFLRLRARSLTSSWSAQATAKLAVIR